MPIDPKDYIQFGFDAVKYIYQIPNPNIQPHPPNAENIKKFEILPLKKSEHTKKDIKKNKDEEKGKKEREKN